MEIERESHEETRWEKTSLLWKTFCLRLAATVTRLIKTNWRWKEIPSMKFDTIVRSYEVGILEKLN